MSSQSNMEVDTPSVPEPPANNSSAAAIISSSAAPSGSSSSSTITTTISPSEKSKKRGLTLDLNLKPVASSSGAGGLTIPAGADLKSSPGFILTSPDVQMLQLASPDLEKLILQGLAAQGNTPTPTQIIFPASANAKTATEEQESYAKGFVDALNALHRSGLQAGMSYNPQTGNTTMFPLNNFGGQNTIPQFFIPVNTAGQQQYIQIAQQPVQFQPQQHQQQQHQQHHQQQQLHPLQTTTNDHIQQQQQQQQQHQPQQQQPMIKVERSPATSPTPSDPQTVPSDRHSTRSSNSSSGAAGPIDMQDQHKRKLERKRERNRLAAAKCRMRKIERIQELEEKNKELRDRNSELSNTADRLQEELERTRQEVLRHLQAGCMTDISSDLLQTLQQGMT